MRQNWHVFSLCVATVLALALLFGGIAVGCSKFTAWNASNGVKQVKNDARKAFYKFCQRKLAVGELEPRCPR